MKIKSIDELKKIKEEYNDLVQLRKQGEGNSDTIEILVGMATCGISSGARETLNAFATQLTNEKIAGAKVISVGCIGYCHSEPTVQVNMNGQKPILYGNVSEDKVAKIIEQHIKGGKPVEELILKVDFERA
ncbi:MAG: NADP oxidoreductase [Firmicutes bacterium HGW-Firmicutes-1]|jgi:NADP-reducing hydrogenase subunit HndB|nr:MAG: NADP oxidoreductase [Firmicutes bacterium HGW-Firmicutes-1]